MTSRSYRFQEPTCGHVGRILDAAQQNNSARAVLLLTHDPDLGLAAAREVAREHSAPLYAMSMAARQQLRPGAANFETTAATAADPVDVLRAGLDVKGHALVFFKDMLRYVSDSSGDPRARAILLEMLSGDNRRPHLYCFCEPPEGECNVPSFARALLTRVSMGLPQGRELLMLAREELAIAAGRTGHALDSTALTEWSRRLAAEIPGLTHSAARFALQDSLSQGFELDAAVKSLAKRKAQHLEKELAMEVMRTHGDPPVGMELFYRWVQTRRDRMCVPGRDRVKGAVLVGPPGTGKTKLGTYLAKLLGVPAVWFRFGAMLGMYVGQSEANAERAFAVLDALGTEDDAGHARGVVVILDELEKTVSSGGNDGGVSMRVTARMLNWMSESTAPNLVLATANDLACMGELADILTRAGRFNKVFFVDVPNSAGRRQLFGRLLAAIRPATAFDLDELASASDRFSGADIEVVVDDAQAAARSEKRPLSTHHVLREVEGRRVRVLAQYDRFNRLREWARLNAEMAGEAD